MYPDNLFDPPEGVVMIGGPRARQVGPVQGAYGGAVENRLDVIRESIIVMILIAVIYLFIVKSRGGGSRPAQAETKEDIRRAPPRKREAEARSGGR